VIKRWIGALLAGMLALNLAGCHRVMDEYEPEKTEYRFAASCYPMYALSLMVVQGAPGLILTCLTQPQTGCLRSYQISEWDAIQAADYDGIILGGRGLESYESTLLAWEDGPILLCAMEGLTLRNQGVTAENENTGHFEMEDPWLFMSPEGAAQMLQNIAVSMQIIDPDYGDMYAANLAAAQEELSQLGERMRAQMENVDLGNVAILHEGLFYFAEFMGVEWVCTYAREPGEDVTDNMLVSLLEKLEKAQVDTVLMEREAPVALVRNLEEAGYHVYLIDTLSSHQADGDAQAYARIMAENAERLSRKEE